MTATTQTKHGGNRKIGRDKIKCQNYRAAKRSEHNKAKRILRSSGAKAYTEYCAANGLKFTLLGGQS